MGDELVPVTQADRDLAASFYSHDEPLNEEIRRGEKDKIGLVQIAAIARIAETEACAKVAEEKFADRGWNSLYRNAGTIIGSAIRSRTMGVDR